MSHCLLKIKLFFFSADAIQAYYNLNRDLFMKKLKEVAPDIFNLFMGKYKGSTDAFFYDVLLGVSKVSQVEYCRERNNGALRYWVPM